MSETHEPARLISPLSEAEIAAIRHEIEHLPDAESAAIEALQVVQQARGWVSDESLTAVAGLLGMSSAALDSIATFYNLIFRRPVGRHVVMLCDSVSCYVMGCGRVKTALEAHLGIRTGQTTSDGRFTLLPIVCLGACDSAPTMLVDDDLVGDLTPDNVAAVLERYP